MRVSIRQQGRSNWEEFKAAKAAHTTVTSTTISQCGCSDRSKMADSILLRKDWTEHIENKDCQRVTLVFVSVKILIFTRQGVIFLKLCWNVGSPFQHQHTFIYTATTSNSHSPLSSLKTNNIWSDDEALLLLRYEYNIAAQTNISSIKSTENKGKLWIREYSGILNTTRYENPIKLMHIYKGNNLLKHMWAFSCKSLLECLIMCRFFWWGRREGYIMEKFHW